MGYAKVQKLRVKSLSRDELVERMLSPVRSMLGNELPSRKSVCSPIFQASIKNKKVNCSFSILLAKVLFFFKSCIMFTPLYYACNFSKGLFHPLHTWRLSCKPILKSAYADDIHLNIKLGFLSFNNHCLSQCFSLQADCAGTECCFGGEGLLSHTEVQGTNCI